MFERSKVDYTLYLVTNDELVPPDLDFYGQVEQALRNGTTLVQLREKELDTGVFIEKAKKIHELTQKYGVPLLINDRIDVALAVDAEGVHIGQGDMDPALARKMIGNEKILGLTVGNTRELTEAIESGVDLDYVGIGAVYNTKTKVLNKPTMGIEGLQEMLRIISTKKPELKSVIIGGLSKYNIASTLKQCSFNGFNTNGVAVVSCIMAQLNAGYETQETLKSIQLGLNKIQLENRDHYPKNPLVHVITNSVAQNFSANVCIAVGGSPIMSKLVPDFSVFSSHTNEALVLNIGTPEISHIPIYKEAIKAHNDNMRPIIFDPVGCGATASRCELMKDLMRFGQFTVIKGNLAELMTVAKGDIGFMRGVDSDTRMDQDTKIAMIRQLAKDHQSIVVLTGEVDYVADGVTCSEVPRICIIEGGHVLMSKITASGCSLGCVIARFVAASSYLSAFEATVNAVSLYKEAGFLAGSVSRGPGSFVPNFLDLLNEISDELDFKNTKILYV